MPDRQATPQPRSRFLDLTEQDLQEWRDHPVSRLLLEFLQAEVRICEQNSLGASLKGDASNATAWAGGAASMRVLFGNCTEPRTPPEPETQDTTFVDPRKRKRRNSDGETSAQ